MSGCDGRDWHRQRSNLKLPSGVTATAEVVPEFRTVEVVSFLFGYQPPVKLTCRPETLGPIGPIYLPS